MNCPRCPRSILQRTQYEQVNVDACADCGGYLVRATKLAAIERRSWRDIDQLADESSRHDPFLDHPAGNCPRCGATMRPRQHLKPVPFESESCRSCQAYWLDAGELALLQIAFESSPRGRDLKRFRDRQRTMSDAERAEHERNMANLPRTIRDPSWTWYSWLGSSLWDF